MVSVFLFSGRGAAQHEGAPAPAITGARANPLPPHSQRWILPGLDAAALVCFVAWWRWMGRTAATGNPASPGALTRLDSTSDAEWKARALAAEARAEKATALLRAKLMPQMARWMMTEVVQRLLSHRSELVTSQNQAEQEVAELEKRLENLHAPLAERLQAYEKRIAELERELAAKGEENRELIQARIASARKKLESERTKEGPLTWN
jgi:flagellar biosynthesis/type III secretory pathway chaperone